jgi:putative membrane protein
MTHILVGILVSTLAVIITEYVLPGVHVSNFGSAVLAAIVLGFINGIIRPILLLITLPINVLTLGLFTLVVMACCVLLASAIVPGFAVDGFWWAVAFALVLAVVSHYLHKAQRKLEYRHVEKEHEKERERELLHR